MTAEQLMGSGVLAGQHEAANLGQVLGAAGSGGIVRTAGPDGLFVDEDPLPSRIAEDHGSEPAVTQRYRVGPYLRRLPVP